MLITYIFDNTTRNSMSLDDHAIFLNQVEASNTNTNYYLLFHATDGLLWFGGQHTIVEQDAWLQRNPDKLREKEPNYSTTTDPYLLMHHLFSTMLPNATKVMLYSGDGGKRFEAIKTELSRYLGINQNNLLIFDLPVPRDTLRASPLFTQMLEELRSERPKETALEFRKAAEEACFHRLKSDLRLLLEACGYQHSEAPWFERYECRLPAQTLNALQGCLDAGTTPAGISGGDGLGGPVSYPDLTPDASLIAWVKAGILQPRDVSSFVPAQGETSGKGQRT